MKRAFTRNNGSAENNHQPRAQKSSINFLQRPLFPNGLKASAADEQKTQKTNSNHFHSTQQHAVGLVRMHTEN